MRTYLDCYPCFIRQALSASRFAHASEIQQQHILHQALNQLQKLNLDATPPEIACHIHELVRTGLDITDPYEQVKGNSTAQALELYPRLKEIVAHSADPIDTAIRLSIAGNIIDLGVNEGDIDLWETVERVLTQDYAIDHTRPLRAALAAVDQVLFLADNAGETVFDRILIEELPIPVTYVVKGNPILNDATRVDAIAAGLDSCCTIIDNGSAAPGTVFPLCSPAFIKTYSAASLIVAKGQGNYETLSNAGEKVYCLLQIKCPVIGRDIGAPSGSIVVRNSKTTNTIC